MPTIGLEPRKWVVKRPILIGAILTGILLLILLAGIYTQIEHHTYQIYFQSFQSQIDESSEQLQHEFIASRNQVRFLRRLPPIEGILRATENRGFDAQDNTRLEQWKSRLATIFTAFLETTPHARQVRYIGVANNGLELVRVERRQGKVIVTPDSQLQAKGNRRYFKAGLEAAADHVYISNIELNREHDSIEKPPWPTFRAVTPIYDQANRIFGEIVINYDATPLLNRVVNIHSIGNHYLVNQNGDYLVNPDPTLNFSFEYGGTHNWKRDFGEAHPVPTSGSWNTSADGNWNYAAARINLGSLQQPQNIYIVASINKDQIGPAIQTKMILILIFVGVLLAGLAFLGWLISTAVAAD